MIYRYIIYCVLLAICLPVKTDAWSRLVCGKNCVAGAKKCTENDYYQDCKRECGKYTTLGLMKQCEKVFVTSQVSNPSNVKRFANPFGAPEDSPSTEAIPSEQQKSKKVEEQAPPEQPKSKKIEEHSAHEGEIAHPVDDPGLPPDLPSSSEQSKRSIFLDEIQKGKVLKKTETKESVPPGLGKVIDETSGINPLSNEVRELYYKLVLSQINRPEKDAPAHDWARGVYMMGRELKKAIGLDKDPKAGSGLPSFYRKFLTTDQAKFSAGLVVVARMQGACSDPTKGYAADYFKKENLGEAYVEAILVDQFTPNQGPPFDVTLYRFFVNALKEIPNLKNLTPGEIQQIKKNLESFKKVINNPKYLDYFE